MGPRLKTAETLATSGTDKMTARQKTAETLDNSGSVKITLPETSVKRETLALFGQNSP
ncbi:hypothetical protein [Companilactobacillus halodurans]|uniref:hypothetical protein n=1 Tax=Companilactobacillus halodurans TaxID=2584183 RepID=UPI001296513F